MKCVVHVRGQSASEAVRVHYWVYAVLHMGFAC